MKPVIVILSAAVLLLVAQSTSALNRRNNFLSLEVENGDDDKWKKPDFCG